MIQSAKRIYKNDGNAPLLALLDDRPARMVLDVGCGAGDNAALIKAKYPDCRIHGVTHSAEEAQIARQWMADCSVFDIEGELPLDLRAVRFDTIVFSHVLEHLREPAAVLDRFSRLLGEDGRVVIAVPNTLSWRMRWRFLRGDFAYGEDGVLDATHLRFFTYLTADQYLLGASSRLKLVTKRVTGSVPLWWLRHHLLNSRFRCLIDNWGCRVWPNLFGEQILMKAVVGCSRATN